jgi:hypothetical protein
MELSVNVSNSGSESWTGIGVVAGVGAVVLIMQWPRGKNRDVNRGSKLLQILQEVRSNCKTRNQLSTQAKVIWYFDPKFFRMCSNASPKAFRH